MKTAVVGSNVMLIDPIVLEGSLEVSKPTKVDGYPSPAVLFNMVDNGMRVDRCKEDLFSVGVIALQLLNLEHDIKQIYKTKNRSYHNMKINYELIGTYLSRIDSPLR